jgi:hypothetical protein
MRGVRVCVCVCVFVFLGPVCVCVCMRCTDVSGAGTDVTCLRVGTTRGQARCHLDGPVWQVWRGRQSVLSGGAASLASLVQSGRSGRPDCFIPGSSRDEAIWLARLATWPGWPDWPDWRLRQSGQSGGPGRLAKLTPPDWSDCLQVPKFQSHNTEFHILFVNRLQCPPKSASCVRVFPCLRPHWGGNAEKGEKETCSALPLPRFCVTKQSAQTVRHRWAGNGKRNIFENSLFCVTVPGLKFPFSALPYLFGCLGVGLTCCSRGRAVKAMDLAYSSALLCGTSKEVAALKVNAAAMRRRGPQPSQPFGSAPAARRCTC